MHRTSIGTWAFNIGPYAEKPIPFDEIGIRLKQLGFDGFELGGFNAYPNPNDMPLRDQRMALKEKVHHWGLEFSGLAADLWSQHLIDTDDQRPYIAEFVKNCDFAADLGIKGIRVDTVQPPTIHAQVDDETALKRVVETWRVCAREAAERGLYVTWEVEPGFAFNKPSDVLRILDRIPDDNFGIMYDTCHGQMVAVVGARQHGARETLPGGQLEFIDRLSGRINHIHLIDSDNTCHKDSNGNDETSAHAPFGEGVIDFDAIVPRLAREKLPHDWWTIDLCFWANAWEQTEKCKKALDELNRKYG